LVDDHSRYLLGLRIADNQQSEPILEWLRELRRAVRPTA
jgi:hypothetical protein